MRANPYCYRYPKSKSHKAVQIKVGKHWLILVFLKNVLCLLIVKEASAPAAVVNNPVTEKIVSLSQSRSVLNLIVSPADHGAIYRCRSFAAPTMTRPVDSDESIVFNVTCKYFFSFKNVNPRQYYCSRSSTLKKNSRIVRILIMVGPIKL